MQTRWWGLGAACALVVACSATTEADDGPDDAGPVGVSRADSGGEAVVPVTPEEDAAVPTGDASEPEDAAPDAATPRDAGGDSGPVDGGVRPDSGPPPGPCTVGAMRCTGLKAELCAGNREWVHDLANQQQCCTLPTRFVPSGDTVTDQQTGRVYVRAVVKGTSNEVIAACAALGARLPRQDELFDLVIGTAEKCSPTIDQVAFPTVEATTAYTVAGPSTCVDFLTGATPTCRVPPTMAICVKN